MKKTPLLKRSFVNVVRLRGSVGEVLLHGLGLEGGEALGVV